VWRVAGNTANGIRDDDIVVPRITGLSARQAVGTADGASDHRAIAFPLVGRRGRPRGRDKKRDVCSAAAV